MAEQLKKGSKLLWYRIDSILGRGGFGVTYLATDTNLETQVAIKEYLPGEIAERKQDSYVIPKTGTDGEMYRWGLTRFIEEARILAKFKHHNIVRVHSVFEENNTAYMVMEYEHGNNLDLMLRTPRFQSEEQLVQVFDAILAGLEQVHAHNIIHRDIKPANIYIREDGSPVLLDFGSARQHVSDRSQNMTRILTKGYAPYEQMDDSGNARQGPWTDIYAIGATLYYAISRKLPTDCLSRFTRVIQKQPDPLTPAREIETQGQFTPEFLFAIDQALQFKGEDRPQNVAEFRELLSAGIRKQSAAPQAPAEPQTVDPDATVLATPAPDSEGLYQPSHEETRFSEELSRPSVPGSSSQRPSQPHQDEALALQQVKSSRIPMLAGAAALTVVMLAGGAYFFLGKQSAPPSLELTEEDITRLEQQAALRKQQAAERAAAEKKRQEKERLAAEQKRLEEEQLAEQKKQEAEQQAAAAKAAEERKAAELTREKARQQALEEQQRLATTLRQKRLVELQQLQQQKQNETRNQQALSSRRQALEQQLSLTLTRQYALESQINRDENRLEQLITAEKAEADRLAQEREAAELLRQEQEKAARQKAEEERLAKEREASEQLKKEQELAARKKAEAEKAAAAKRKAQQQKELAAKKAKAKTVVAAKSKAVSSAVQKERKQQESESDMQSISRLFNDFRVNLANCELQALKSGSKAQNSSIGFVDSLCQEYSRMDISIRNFQSNIRRGVASADVTIQKLTSKSGDTVLPSKSWNTLPIKTQKSGDGFWQLVEW